MIPYPKGKVPKHVPNFNGDAYLHVTTHMREDLVGTLSYFLLDVEDPPPELLLDVVVHAVIVGTHAHAHVRRGGVLGGLVRHCSSLAPRGKSPVAGGRIYKKT